MAISTPLPCEKGVVLADPATSPCTAEQGRWILVATVLGSSMVFIEGTVVNVVLPVLQREMNASVADVQWVVVAYALILASLLLIGGSLGDHYGRRLIFGVGVAIFGLASIACGLVSSIDQLIIARAVQGVGGALLVPGSLALISASFDGERRGAAIGTWSGFSSISAGVGPLVGGWLIENVSWRWAFLMTAPMAVAVLAILFWKVPESRDETAPRSLDWTGALLATSGLRFIVSGLIESANRGITDILVVGVVVLGFAALGTFVAFEQRSSAPMMPVSLFRSRTFSGANLLTLLLYTAMIGATFYLPFNLIQVRGYSATAAGAALLPFVLLVFLLSRWSGGLVTRTGPKLPLVVGPTNAALGLALLAVPGTGGSYWTTFFPAIAVLGLGMAVAIAPLTTTVMGAVDQRFAGVASGINNTASRTAGAVAVAIMSVVMLGAFDSSVDDRVDDLGLTPEQITALDDEKVNLAAAALPDGLDAETTARVEAAIDDAFVSAFRIVAIASSVLALMSAVVAALMIEGKATRTEAAARDDPVPRARARTSTV